MAKQPVAPAQRRTPQRNPQGRGTTRRVRVSDSRVSWNFPLDKTNVMILLAGLAVIVVGYILMGTAISDDPANNEGIWNNAASVTVAPILLTIGYCVIIPLGIIYRKRRNDAADRTDAPVEA